MTQRLPSAPDRDVALLWDIAHGWALGLENADGEDVNVLAYLGGARAVADPEAVVVFAKTMLAGQDAGRSSPPVRPADDDLALQLAEYAASG